MKNSKVLKMIVLAMMVGLGVVISPILRFEGMCPMAHLINIVCSVLMGPWYSLLCATLIGIIRMLTMGIPPIALTGAVFGAFLSGVFYRMSKGSILMAVLGEIIGTGLIGAVMSYPVMTFIWGRDGLSWLFYIPSFVCGTLIGGSIAFVFLRKLSKSGVLKGFQEKLSPVSYEDKSSVLSDSASIAAFGVICFMIIKILTGIFKMISVFWSTLAWGAMAAFITGAVIYYFVKRRRADGAE